jgi:hypothetical protein
MTISYDLATDIGKIRLIIQDTAGAKFSDEELQIFLDLEGSVNLASAAALESWAAYLSEYADSEHIGDYSYSKKLVSNKLDLATRLRENDANAPSLDWAEMNFTDIDEDEAIE